MRPLVPKIFAGFGLVMSVALSACTSEDGADESADTGDTQQSASPEPTAVETTGVDGDAADGSATIGGEETGITLEIPEEWIDVPLDADTMSEGLSNLDLPDDQAGLIESSVGALGTLDGAVMAVDASTLGSSVATNVNAYCIQNDGSVGEGNLEAVIELGLGAIADGVEVEDVSVDGVPAVRASYSLEMGRAQGFGLQYMFLDDGDICWVTFTAADESQADLFEEIAATIQVL